MRQKQRLVLLAEDDADDRMLIQKAFQKNFEEGEMLCVEDGAELLKYLRRQAPYKNEEQYPQPGLILLDLNMPRKDGREALKEIKADKQLCKIPVVIFTTSRLPEDIDDMYQMGSNSYITKPASFEELKLIAREIDAYWFKTVELPV
jgi:CheY-like chemotaxis protein